MRHPPASCLREARAGAVVARRHVAEPGPFLTAEWRDLAMLDFEIDPAVLRFLDFEELNLRFYEIVIRRGVRLTESKGMRA